MHAQTTPDSENSSLEVATLENSSLEVGGGGGGGGEIISPGEKGKNTFVFAYTFSRRKLSQALGPQVLRLTELSVLHPFPYRSASLHPAKSLSNTIPVRATTYSDRHAGPSPAKNPPPTPGFAQYTSHPTPLGFGPWPESAVAPMVVRASAIDSANN